MDKSTAQRVVSQAFKASFDRDRFRNFVNELTNGFDETKKQTMQIPDAFKSSRIHKIEALKAKFFDESDAENKRALRAEIDTEIHAAFANSKKSLGYELA